MNALAWFYGQPHGFHQPRERRIVVAVTGPTGLTRYVRDNGGATVETGDPDRATIYTTLENARYAEAAHDKRCLGQRVCIYLVDLDEAEWRDGGDS